MNGTILKINRKIPQETTLPDGVYFGLYGGYIILVEFDNKQYELTTVEGLRGINAKVVVTIKDGIGSYVTLTN